MMSHEYVAIDGGTIGWAMAVILMVHVYISWTIKHMEKELLIGSRVEAHGLSYRKQLRRSLALQSILINCAWITIVCMWFEIPPFYSSEWEFVFVKSAIVCASHVWYYLTGLAALAVATTLLQRCSPLH